MREKSQSLVFLFVGLIAFAFASAISTAYAIENQIVTLSATPVNPAISDQIKIGVDYDVSDGNKLLAGIHLRIHYNSSKLTYTGYDPNTYMNLGTIKQNPDGYGGAQDDTSNYDADSSTDKFIQASWLTFTYPADWPGDDETLPLRLIDVLFAPAGAGPVSVNLSFQSGDPSYGRLGYPVTFSIDCPLASISAFTADTSLVCSGGDVLLSWSTSGATTVSISGIDDPVAASGTTTVNPTQDTTYVLTATNACGPVTQEVSVTVVADKPVIDSLTAAADVICKNGDGTSLTWQVTGANTISFNQDGIEIANAPSGSVDINPTVTTTYTLTATNLCGSTTAEVTVTVNDKPVINSFTTSAATICKNTSATLSWDVTNATGVTINNDAVALSGTLTVSPTVDTTYVLSATNGCGTADVREVTVSIQPDPVITSFTAASATICKDASTTLSWVVSDGATVSIDNGVVVQQGNSVVVSPETTTTYTLTATDSCQTSVTSEVIVMVNDLPTITAFTVSPGSVCQGEGATLSWTIANATSAAIGNTAVNDVTSGTLAITPTETTTYTLTATNDCGSVTQDVTINMPLPVIGSFSANPATITLGDSTVLTWTVTGEGETTVSIDNAIGEVADAGNTTVTPQETTTYTLTAINDCGTVTKAATVTVNIIYPPEAPVLKSPVNAAAGVPLMAELQTEAFSDQDGDAHAMTRWQVATDQLFTEDSLVYDEISEVNLLSIIVPTDMVLESNSSYYWRVMFHDGIFWSEPSQAYSFVTVEGVDYGINGIRTDSQLGEGDVVELGGDFLLDGNPVITDEQKIMKSVTKDTVQIGLKSENATITKCGSVDPKDFKDVVGKVPNLPYGLVEIALDVPNPGDTAVVTVYFSEPIKNDSKFAWWKYDPNKGIFYEYADVVKNMSADGKSIVSVTLTLKDGGNGDLIENPDGRIIDPSGPGTGGSGGGSDGTCFIGILSR